MSTIKYLYTFEMDEKISDCYDCPLCDNEQSYCVLDGNNQSYNSKSFTAMSERKCRPLDCPLDEMEMEMDESEDIT
jgi:hypothetical protein